jgi:hypothetical protein
MAYSGLVKPYEIIFLPKREILHSRGVRCDMWGLKFQSGIIRAVSARKGRKSATGALLRSIRADFGPHFDWKDL